MQSGRKVGSFPYLMRSVPGRTRCCGMPPLTPWLGPAIDPGSGAAPNTMLRGAQVTRELLTQLPPCGAFRHKLHRGTADTLIYQELGYETSVEFAFEVAAAPPDVSWHAMRSPVRDAVAGAGRQHSVGAADEALFLQPALTPGWTAGDRALARRVCRAALEHGQGHVLMAETLAGSPAAAILVVWDRQAAYCVLTARAAGCGDEVVALLLWHALGNSAVRCVTFDFDSRAARLRPEWLAGLGGRPSPRYVVSRYALGYKLAGRLLSPFGKVATRFGVS